MMNLDFIPVCNEEYDLAIPEEFIELDIIKEFIETIKFQPFSRSKTAPKIVLR